MDQWTKLANQASLDETVTALKQNGFEVKVAETGSQAKQLALELLPEQAEVMTTTSITLETIGLAKKINESAKFNSIRNKLNQMDRQTQKLDMQKLGAAPEYTIGSIHAVTQNGEVIIASNTGSQLPAYAYGAAHVIWVVGTQKIVENLDQGFKRIYEYCLAKESARAHLAYGVDKSAVNKILIINKEIVPHRITVILVKELLGF